MERRKITIELDVITEITVFEQQQYLLSAVKNYIKPLFDTVKNIKIKAEPIKE